MSAIPQYFDWPTAKQAMAAGWQVRRSAWTTQWLLQWLGGLYWLVFSDGTASRVVQAADFGAAEFLATDWTNLPPPCITTGTVGGTSVNGCPLPFDPTTATPLSAPVGAQPDCPPAIMDGGMISFPA